MLAVHDEKIGRQEEAIVAAEESIETRRIELSEKIDSQTLFDEFCNTKDLVAKYFEDREYSTIHE